MHWSRPAALANCSFSTLRCLHQKRRANWKVVTIEICLEQRRKRYGWIGHNTYLISISTSELNKQLVLSVSYHIAVMCCCLVHITCTAARCGLLLQMFMHSMVCVCVDDDCDPYQNGWTNRDDILEDRLIWAQRTMYWMCVHNGHHLRNMIEQAKMAMVTVTVATQFLFNRSFFCSNTACRLCLKNRISVGSLEWVFGRPYCRSCLWHDVSSVCLSSSVMFCIVSKRYVLVKNCLKKWIGNQGQKVDFFGSPPYFYFRFRHYGHQDGRFCLTFARIAQQSVLDGTNGVSSSKPCAYCRIVRPFKWTVNAYSFALRVVKAYIRNCSNLRPYDCIWTVELVSHVSRHWAGMFIAASVAQ